MSDHYQTAIDWVSAAEQDPQHNTPENLAIAEAVLALAEQQRIANLISLAKTGYGRLIADEVGTLDDGIARALRIETP